MSQKKYPEDKPSKHATIRIPKMLADAVDEFLKTDAAKKRGYLYKIDVITAATRELLEKYGFFVPVVSEAEPPSSEEKG